MGGSFFWMSFRALGGSPSPWGKPGCGSGWVSANSSNSEPKVTGAERKGNGVAKGAYHPSWANYLLMQNRLSHSMIELPPLGRVGEGLHLLAELIA